MSTVKTTAEVAALLERSPHTLRLHARKYKIGKVYGKVRLYTAADIERMREITSRPPGARKKASAQ